MEGWDRHVNSKMGFAVDVKTWPEEHTFSCVLVLRVAKEGPLEVKDHMLLLGLN
jgi:hypothetical protein